MKNILKKSTMLLLCVLLMGSILTPIFAQATETVTISQDDEYIYYSDLFYAYPYYLKNDVYFNDYSRELLNLYLSIYDSYANSDLIKGTGLDKALNTITKPNEIVTLITDAMGVTDFSYNDALDAANEQFVRNVLSDSVIYSLETEYGKMASQNAKIIKTLSYFKTVDAESEDDLKIDNVEYWSQVIFDELKSYGYLTYISDQMFSNLWVKINNGSEILSECFGATTKPIDMAKGIVSSMLLEDARLEIVDEILATQTEETVLKQGMLRLKKDLQEGFSLRIIDNYIKNKISCKILNLMNEWIVEGFYPKDFSVLISIAKSAFNALIEVPSYEEVLKWQVLICYSTDLANTIRSKADVFSAGPFYSDDIIKYENLFVAYDAVNKAAMQTTEKIVKMGDPFSEVYTLFEEARNNNIKTITIKSGVTSISIPSSISDQEMYRILALGVYTPIDGNPIPLGKVITATNGEKTVSIRIKANIMASVIVGCISGTSSEAKMLQSFNNVYGNKSLYGQHIQNAKNTILQTEKGSRVTSASICNSWTYSVNGDTQIRLQSDEVESGCIYTFNDFIQGNVSLSGSYAVPSGLKFGMNGSFTMGCWDSLTIPEDSSLVVKKNLNVNAWGWSTGYRSTILNDGYLDVQNTLSGYGFLKGSGKYVFNNVAPSVESAIIFENATYEFLGTVSQVVECVSSSIIVSGKTQQSLSLKGTVKSLDVFSPKLSLTSNASISDYIDFHGNDVNVLNAISVSNGTIIKEGSNYKNLYFSDRYTLTNNICADYMEFNGGLTVESGSHVLDGYAFFWYGDNFITINEDAELCINGDAEGCEWRWQPIRTSVQNNGTMTVTGTLYYRWNLGGSGTYNLNNTSGEYITLLGGIFNIFGNTSQPINVSNANSVNVSGKEKQSIGLSGNVQCLVLNNSTITEFLSPLRVTRLFNHNGNSFELYNNGLESTFADYDGDGLKDNIDPYPTCAKHNYKEWIKVDQNTHKRVCECGAEEMEAHTNTTYCSKCQVKITGASITAGVDLSMKYYVGLYDTTLVDISNGEQLAMQFTMNGKTATVYANADLIGGEHVFVFENIAPQQMADLIDAVLVVVDENGEIAKNLAEKNGYSVKENAEALLKAYKDDAALVQFATDMLTYGAAAQNYKDYNTDNLANKDLSSEVAPSKVLPTESIKNVTASASSTVYFTSATVWFDNVNKIGVKLFTTENVKLVVNGVEVELTGTTYYTDAIYATGFDTVYTFELYEGETLVQTLTYSVSSYVYAMMNKVDNENNPTKMAELAKALYRYGTSAVAYKNAQTFES